MKWTTTRRETGLVEHVCEHNVGHPNHGSALWIAEARAREDFIDEKPLEDLIEEHEWANRIHGCDGCCRNEVFPGTYRGALIHAHLVIRERNDEIRVQVDCIQSMARDLVRAERRWWRGWFS